MDSKSPISQKLTPKDLKTKDFGRSMWGYNPKHVAEFLDTVAKTWERVQKTEKDLMLKIDSLGEEIQRYKAREGEFGKIREGVLAEAEAIKEKAVDDARRMYTEVEDRANEIRMKTEEWLATAIEQVEETERQKRNFVTAFRQALDSHSELLKKDEEFSEPLPSRLDNFLKSTLAGEKSLPS